MAHLSGNGALALTSLTPEGLILERPGPAVDRIYPLVQEGDSDVTYNDVTGGAWQGVFQ